MTEQEKARTALDWALDNTCFAIPRGKRTAASWTWNEDDKSLSVCDDDGDFRFHVAMERRGVRRIRIAVLRWDDEDGGATWECPIPDHVIGVAV